jgi:GAF domain-containing protein
MIPEAQLKDLRGRIETSALGALDVLQADAVWIYYYNEEAQCFEPTPATFPLDAKAAPGPEIEQLLLAISNSDRPQFFETFTGDKPWHTAFANLTNICSIAGDGLKAKGRTIGIMICGYQTPQSFSEERQFRIRRYISDSAVQAAEQSEKTALLDGLYKMTLESTAEGSSRPGLQSVLDVAVKLTGAQYGALGIMSLGPQRQLRDFLVSGVDEKLKNELPHPVGKGLLGRLLDTDDCINEPDISNRDFGHPSHPKITSFLGTSILVDSKSVGNLYVGNKKDIGTFTEEDMTLLKILANWASETYQRSHSRQQVSTQEAITIATVMLSQLEQSAKDKGVKWSANLRKIADALEAGSRQVLNEIAVEAEKLATPISAFQEGLEARPSTQPLDDILAQLVSVKRQEQRDIRIDSEIEPACSVRGRELLLRIACEIPLENAIRSTRKANRIEVPIRISCKVSGRSPEPQFVVCTISDAGTGIPEKVKDRIFDEPFRYDDKNHDNSFIAGRIIQLHGGEISIIETGEAGTTVKFWFPLANK